MPARLPRSPHPARRSRLVSQSPDVTRHMSLMDFGAGFAAFPDVAGPRSALAGDPYPEGDVTRSLALLQPGWGGALGTWASDGCGREEYITGFGASSYADAGLPRLGGPHPKDEGRRRGGPAAHSATASGLGGDPPSFRPEHQPPALPADPLFRLEATTVWVRTTTPAHRVANAVLDAMRERAVIVSTKVRHGKFAVKAELLVDGLACCVKVRIYDTGHGDLELSATHRSATPPPRRLAVEAQRRGGDAVAFAGVFSAVSRRLAVHFGAAAAEAPRPTAEPPDLGAEGLGAIGGLARHGRGPRLEALAALARAGPPAAALIVELLEAAAEDADEAALLLAAVAARRLPGALLAAQGGLAALLGALRRAPPAARLDLSLAFAEAAEAAGAEAPALAAELQELALRCRGWELAARANLLRACHALEAPLATAGPCMYS